MKVTCNSMFYDAVSGHLWATPKKIMAWCLTTNWFESVRLRYVLLERMS